ncbi:cap [Porprismacovirus macas7]|uniref:Cap n=1 Tax=Macaca mulatta feces associated virus 1 TaxID=2499223 RepID=A0A1W5PXG9_9VIRU|nr:cap [Macaca mulatta feces associated virus 1]
MIEFSRRKNNHGNIAHGKDRSITNSGASITIEDSSITSRDSRISIPECSVETGHSHSRTTHEPNINGFSNRIPRSRSEISGIESTKGSIHSRGGGHRENDRIKSLHGKTSLGHSLLPTFSISEETIVHIELIDGNIIIELETRIIDIYDRTLIHNRIGNRGLPGFEPSHEIRHGIIGYSPVKDRVEHILRGDIPSRKTDLERISRKHRSTSESNIAIDELSILVIHRKTAVHLMDEFRLRSVDTDNSHFAYLSRQIISFRYTDKNHGITFSTCACRSDRRICVRRTCDRKTFYKTFFRT